MFESKLRTKERLRELIRGIMTQGRHTLVLGSWGSLLGSDIVPVCGSEATRSRALKAYSACQQLSRKPALIVE